MVHTVLSQLKQNQKNSETTIFLQEPGFVAKQQTTSCFWVAKTTSFLGTLVFFGCKNGLVWKANWWCLRSTIFCRVFEVFALDLLTFVCSLGVFFLFWLLIYFLLLLLFHNSGFYVLVVVSCCFLVSWIFVCLFVICFVFGCFGATSLGPKHSLFVFCFVC